MILQPHETMSQDDGCSEMPQFADGRDLVMFCCRQRLPLIIRWATCLFNRLSRTVVDYRSGRPKAISLEQSELFA